MKWLGEWPDALLGVGAGSPRWTSRQLEVTADDTGRYSFDTALVGSCMEGHESAQGLGHLMDLYRLGESIAP